MDSRKVQHFFIKGLWYLSMKIGQAILIFKKRTIYKRDKLDEIVINRSDRIGDATLTKPLLTLFQKYARQSWYKGTFTILVSSINKSVFDDFDGVVELVDEDIKIDSGDIVQITWLKIVQWLNSFRLKTKKRSKKERTLLIDLVGRWDMSVLHHYYKKGYTAIVSCNLSFSSSMLSNRINTPFTTFQWKRNLMETYIDLIEATFDLDGKFREYVYENISLFYPEYLVSERLQKPWVLIFVWCKEDRNFSVKKRVEIIDYFAKNFPWPITVIDDNLNNYYKLLSQTHFSSSVEVIENKFSLAQFKTFAWNFGWIVWLDGGGMNHIRSVTNNLTIFTLADSNIWSAFVGGTTYKKTNVSREWIVGKAAVVIWNKTLYNTYAARKSFWHYEDFEIAPVYNQLFANKDTK